MTNVPPAVRLPAKRRDVRDAVDLARLVLTFGRVLRSTCEAAEAAARKTKNRRMTWLSRSR